MLKAKLSKWQKEVADDPTRFKIICAGRRSGKSTYAQLQILKWAVEKPGLYFIVSPTYKSSKMIHWRELKQIIPRAWIEKTNETELSFTLKNKSVIELKGAENPDALRGIKLHGLVIDEIASIRNWDWLWQEVLRPTLTDYSAPAIFISTPKGYNHFYELFTSGQDTESDYKSWRFTSYDNPYIPKEEIDAAKDELTEDTFAQEYMADFRKYTGLVYKLFERDTHVIEPFDIPEGWEIYRGFDFGSTNPTAVTWIAVDTDQNFFVIDEHYKTGETIDYHANIVRANKYSERVTSSYGDPSGKQWMDEFNTRGVYITAANKETGQNQAGWVNYGIEKVNELLKPLPGRIKPHDSIQRVDDGTWPRLFVFSNCGNTIKEFETYRWKEKSVNTAQDLNEPDQPEKANDHLMDALRYVVVSYINNPSRQKDQELFGRNYENVNKGLADKWSL